MATHTILKHDGRNLLAESDRAFRPRAVSIRICILRLAAGCQGEDAQRKGEPTIWNNVLQSTKNRVSDGTTQRRDRFRIDVVGAKEGTNRCSPTRDRNEPVPKGLLATKKARPGKRVSLVETDSLSNDLDRRRCRRDRRHHRHRRRNHDAVRDHRRHRRHRRNVPHGDEPHSRSMLDRRFPCR